jgi:excisionase family DNA binding protein
VPAPASPAAPEAPLLLTVTRAAELLGVSRSTLYQLVAAGRVPVVRLGRAVRVPRRELERMAADV